MSDRLRELHLQRALLEEHLAWLDREIAAAQGLSSTPRTISPAVSPLPPIEKLPSPVVPVSKPADFPDAAAAERAAEEIMAQYQREGQSVHGNVKRGCFLYFFLALGVVGLGVVALYFFRTKH